MNTKTTQDRTFIGWPKTPRLKRQLVITEKIDGTNACIVITEDDIYAQSRKRIITPDDDNYGFAKWVAENEEEIRAQLGEGRHFGEWWGSGIQKRYNGHIPQGEKRFSLFNTSRWTGSIHDFRCTEAPLFFVVPVLRIMSGIENTTEDILNDLMISGSHACPGAEAEGIIVFHTAANQYFKVTLDKDDEHKGQSK